MIQEPPTQNSTLAVISVLAPYLFQAFVLLLMTVIILVRDGISTDTAINALVLIGGGNALAGGITSAANIITKGRVDNTRAGKE